MRVSCVDGRNSSGFFLHRHSSDSSFSRLGTVIWANSDMLHVGFIWCSCFVIPRFRLLFYGAVVELVSLCSGRPP